MSTQIAIVGAGVMGSGIAQVLALAGHAVRCTDVSPDVLATARDEIENGRFGLRSAVDRGRIEADEVDATLARIVFTSELDEAVDGASVVLEAIPEQLDLKVAFWRDLDRRAGASTIFASNSSGFPIQAFAAATDRPDRVIGWHWASPAPVMRMAEIVRTAKTSAETVDTIVELARGAGKNPIVIDDDPRHWGYVANRVYAAMIGEAERVIAGGIATREQVDQLMIDCFRWPTGPYGMARGASSGWSR